MNEVKECERVLLIVLCRILTCPEEGETYASEGKEGAIVDYRSSP
jgi:hypothetical protein